ncbi:MAG: cyclic lactone autoinducer peptide [Clostridiales bacterium]|nr:MAG: cyclic lactone autoinducer peptide [Clostridiales bacterium]
MAANSSCVMPFYEPEEPKGLEKNSKNLTDSK